MVDVAFFFLLESLPWGNGQATTGWDPVTGLGTPDFGKLKDILVPYNPPLPTLLSSLVGALLNLRISLFISLKLL
jgi:hypothetical protein